MFTWLNLLQLSVLFVVVVICIILFCYIRGEQHVQNQGSVTSTCTVNALTIFCSVSVPLDLDFDRKYKNNSDTKWHSVSKERYKLHFLSTYNNYTVIHLLTDYNK